MRHIPNLLTISRFFLALLYPWAPVSWRLGIIIIALLTEFFDGYLSRKFNWGSRLGALLDPIADKAFIFVVALTLFVETDLTWWQLLLVGARDVVVFFGAAFVALEHNWKAFMHVHPRISGKAATACQFALLITHAYTGTLSGPLLITTTIVSCIAGVDYLVLLFKRNFYREYMKDKL